MNPETRVIEAELTNPEHQRAVVAMTAAYANDTMGNRGPLAPEVLDRLVPALQDHPASLILLAYRGEEAVGIATCFIGFSTFAARPLINIHDLAVLPEHRGQGVGRALLEAVQRTAQQRGYVKVTLEVQEHNRRARRLYEVAGFSQAMHGDLNGGCLFYTKSL